MWRQITGNKSSCMLTLSVLLFAALCLEADVIWRTICPAVEMNWKEARLYCQKNHIDLATWNFLDDYELDQYCINHESKLVWIGRLRDPKNDIKWEWINVKNGEGQEREGEDCGAFDLETAYLMRNNCSQKSLFFCYDYNLVVVNENKTWEDALWHCKNLKTTCKDPSEPCNYELLTLTPETPYNHVQDRIHRATTDEVWMGLRFLGGEWWWADGQEVEDNQTLQDCPAQLKHCGTLSKNVTNWITRDCSERRNFICYRT